MVRLEEQYEQAVQFRKRGFTYSEIAKIVGVSKSTVSNWVAKKAFSKRVRADNAQRAARDNVKRIGLVNKTRTAQRKEHYAQALRSAQTEFVHYKKDALFIAGLMAYTCDGDQKDGSRIRLSSSDFFIHRTFIQFAQAYLGVDKNQIRFTLTLLADQSEKKYLALWCKKTRLSLSQFYKTQFLAQKSKNKALQHGTGNTIIGNTVLKKKLVRWIELLEKEL